ncbi:MAG: FKBP-type peptidyl-prolyl cis-trans isomerase [Bacteroidia bacterium]
MKYLIALSFLFMLACTDNQSIEERGAIYTISGEDCFEQNSEYFLMDVILRDQNDSVMLNTIELGRKLEISRGQLDSQMLVAELIMKLCSGDSLNIELSADSFYMALGGVRPISLENQKINAWIRMQDKLTSLQYEVHKQLFEKQSMVKYVEKYRWNASFDSTTGIHYEKLKTSRSSSSDFKKASFKYVLKTINEDLIAYSKDEDPLIIDLEKQDVMKGIKFLAMKLKEGESARALIPSSSAFGTQGNEKVPPYFPIILELEYLEKIE